MWRSAGIAHDMTLVKWDGDIAEENSQGATAVTTDRRNA